MSTFVDSQVLLSIYFYYLYIIRRDMKRDHTTIKDRIDELGVKHKHVATQCGIDHTVLSKIMKGEKYRLDKDKIKSVHDYLDKVKTRKGIDFK